MHMFLKQKIHLEYTVGHSFLRETLWMKTINNQFGLQRNIIATQTHTKAASSFLNSIYGETVTRPNRSDHYCQYICVKLQNISIVFVKPLVNLVFICKSIAHTLDSRRDKFGTMPTNSKYSYNNDQNSRFHMNV